MLEERFIIEIVHPDSYAADLCWIFIAGVIGMAIGIFLRWYLKD